MWQFAAGLYLVHLAGGELRLAAIFGFTAGGAIMLFGGIIGHWVDMNSRLKGKLASGFSVFASAVFVFYFLNTSTSFKNK